MHPEPAIAVEYDIVELRTGRLHRIRRSEARVMDGDDRMVAVAKCYCRSNDIITAAEAESQKRPTFVFPAEFFRELETLIGKDLEGRIYMDSNGRRVRFYLDLKEHAGFQMDDRNLHSPWYDDNVIKD